MASNSAYTEYDVQLIDSRLGSAIDDDTGVYTVMTVATPAAATCYSNSVGTSLTLPATMTDGRITFYTASSVASVDVSGLTASGHPFFIKALTPSQHRFEIDVDKRNNLQLIIPFTFSASAISATDTGFDLNALHVLKEIAVKVTTAGGTSNVITVGNSASISAFFYAVLSATGLKVADMDNGSAQVAATVSLTHVAGYGNSMLFSSTAMNALTAYFGGAVTSITYTEANQTGATGAGYIYMLLDRLVV